jgi:Phosphatidylethanolamine-binding protein
MAQRRQRQRQTRRRSRTRRQRGGALQVEGISFPQPLQVQLDAGRTANGQLISRNLTLREPVVSWTKTPGMVHTFLVVDPDAPAKSWLHWLVVNCEGAYPDTGTEVAPWEAPNPGSGTHRYFFCLFQHGAPISADDAVPAQRGYWNFKEFVSTHGLVPVAAAMIQVKAASHSSPNV